MTLCAPWIDVDSPFICCAIGDDDPEPMERAILIASHLLYRASGLQFPGVCTDTIRPCAGCGGIQFLAYGRGGSRPITWEPWSCGCSGNGGPGCTARGIALPSRPVQGVTEVKVDGTAVATTAYRVADGYVLIRADGQGWTTHQDMGLEDTEDGTWSITYTYGNLPDPAGLAAVADLACSVDAACRQTGECDLPEGLQSLIREGVTMTIDDPTPFLDGGGWGIPSVDRWLDVVNPHRIDRPGKWFSTATIGNLHS